MTKVQKWGLPVPKDILDTKGKPRSYWGTRAIFQWRDRNPIDLLHDRQYFEPEGALYPLLQDWINEKGLPWLREKLKGMVDPGEPEMFRFDQLMYGIVGQARGGYVYIGAWRHDTDRYKFELLHPDPDATWSGKFPIPKPGDRVRVTSNGFGPATVLDYSVGDGFLGVRVKPDNLPPWFVKQNPYTVTGTFYGAELALPF